MSERKRLVIVAPDKFKGSLTAAEAARIVAATLREEAPWAQVIESPIADGGDGTVDLATRAGFTRVTVTVPGPLSEPVCAQYAVSGSVAVIELAAAAGLALVPNPPDDTSARNSSTYGAGLLIADALDHGAGTVVLGLGGSATTDGGAGLVMALGARLTDAFGTPLDRGGITLRDLSTLDLADLTSRLQGVDLVLACDVDNPLLGSDGAAAVYGPQKGASEATVADLEVALSRWADIVAGVTGRDLRSEPGAGAAGGAGFAGLALLGGRMVSGIDFCMELSGLRQQLSDADLVIVGEGSLDRQSLRGKGPVALAAVAAGGNASVVAVSGRCTLTSDELMRSGIDAVYALADLEPDTSVCMTQAPNILRASAARIARDWLFS